MMGGSGPRDCPYYNSPEMQQWRAQRDQRQKLPPAERQKLMQHHRERMWAQHSGATSS